MNPLAFAEDLGAVPRQVPLVSMVRPLELQRDVEAKGRPGGGTEGVRDDHRAVLCDGDEAGVERGVEMWREQQAVEYVEALRVRVAVGPGLDVARAEEIGNVEAGDRATTVLVLQQAATEDVLTDSLDHQALGFRRPRRSSCPLFSSARSARKPTGLPTGSPL